MVAVYAGLMRCIKLRAGKEKAPVKGLLRGNAVYLTALRCAWYGAQEGTTVSSIHAG